MKKNIVILSLATLLGACVTINIYFPAAAAQEVADEIINDVWQLKEGEKAKKADSIVEEQTDVAPTETTEPK